MLLILPVLIEQALKGRAVSRLLSPVVVCFVMGIAAGTFGKTYIDRDLSATLQDVSIILAIPMLLMSSHFVKWLPRARSVLFAFAMACVSVFIAVTVAFFLFRHQTTDAWMISSMFLAGFTGTIANANAVGNALDCPEDVLLLVNLGDMISGAVYLILLTSVAHPLLSRILPAYRPFLSDRESGDEGDAGSPVPEEEDFGYISRYRMKRFGVYVAPVVLSGLILGAAMGLEMLFFPGAGQEGTFILITVTLLGIASSFNRQIRELRSSFRIGQYLLLLFCLALGTLIDFNEALRASPLILTYAAVVMVMVIAINVVLARWFGIDADTAIITSTAAIYGPPFIGQVAVSMKNREIIFSGMIASMVGIAVGNFLGLGLAGILKALM